MNLDMYSHACKPIIVQPTDTNEMPLGPRVLEYYGGGEVDVPPPDGMTQDAFFEILASIDDFKRKQNMANMFGFPDPERPDVEEKFFELYDEVMRRRQANDILFNRARDEGVVLEAACGGWVNLAPLHAWMECLYKGRGGTKEFNCVPIIINPSDIDSLERDLSLPVLPGCGKFYEERALHPEEREELAEFIAKAREQHAQNLVVVYDSWW